MEYGANFIKPSEMWKEIKPKIDEMLMVVNNIETQAEKAQEEAYQKGLSDAWDAARTLWNTPNRKEIFGHTTFNTVLTTLTAQEAIEKIRQYEQEKEEQIQVGDEVITASGKAVVMGVGPVHFEYVYADGSHGYDEVKNVKKTGRNFPEIAEVLQKMREGQEQ